MDDALLLAPVAIGLAALLWLRRAPRSPFSAELAALAAGFQGGSVHVSPRLPGCHVHGALGGRPARVSFARSGEGEQAHTAIVYDLAVLNPAATFEVAERDTRQSLGHFLGLARADALDDPNLVVRARGHGASRLLQATDVRAALQRLFALGVSTVSLRWSGLRVEQRGDVRAQAMGETLQALLELSRLCGRVPVSELISVQPRPARARRAFVWTGGGATARCPYCRDELDVTAPEVAACDRCATVHHTDCLAEAGGCTIFGCGARQPAQPRDARRPRA